MQGIEKIIEKIISDAKLDAKETKKQMQSQITALKKTREDETHAQIAELDKETKQKMLWSSGQIKTLRPNMTLTR